MSQLWRESTDDEMGAACTCVFVWKVGGGGGGGVWRLNFRRRTPTVLLGAHTTTAQHCFCAVQLNWCRGDPWME